jgi:methylated-DNA-[protein]-cysteine S-methyltransferase
MEKLQCTYYHSPIGLIKIIGTSYFITEISFVDNSENLLPATSTTELIHECTEELIEFFHGKRRTFDLPIYQQGSDFQKAVWNELLSIPFGSTISYAELAKKIGNEKAVRAVAAANAKNKLVILLPCHRVIGSSHQLTGYSGGLWRKKWLLQWEFKVAHGVQSLF